MIAPTTRSAALAALIEFDGISAPPLWHEAYPASDLWRV